MAPPLKPITLTDAAAAQVKAILANAKTPVVGIRIGVNSKGCSGQSYVMDYAEEKGPHDEIFEDNGVTILIDPKATLFIFGTEIDYVEDTLESGFVFRNPNETGRCGCGASFTV